MKKWKWKWMAWFLKPPYCHVYGVTMDGFWIDDQIYWILWYSRWLHLTVHYYTYTNQCPQSCLHCCCLVVASKGGCSPSSGFPNSPQPQLPTSNSNRWQQISPSSSLTHQLTTNSSSLLVLLATSHTYIHTLHSMDPKLVKMTAGCGISHTIIKTHTSI
jgi:hypothetical protein